MICRSERKSSTISRAGFREWEFSSTEKEILHGSGCHVHERLIQAGTGKMRKNNRMIKRMKSKRRFKRYLVYLAKSDNRHLSCHWEGNKEEQVSFKVLKRERVDIRTNRNKLVGYIFEGSCLIIWGAR